MSVYPTIFKGYRSSRIFISGNNVSSDNYIYAKEIKGIWSQSDGKSCRFDKIMINKDYFDENFLKNNKCSKPNKYIDAPPVIKLEDHEKFYNNDDEIVEIEVLGERDPNNCYFKLRDIALGFDMHGLRKVILDERRDGYQLNKHYVIFHTLSNKKILFVTYLGFIRIVNNAKTIYTITQYVIHKWLQQFSQNKIEKFIISNQIIFNNLAGYVYSVTSPILNAIKIGFWRSFYEGLIQRYKTVYGNDVQIHVVTTFNAICV